jgi:hypothetical protein
VRREGAGAGVWRLASGVAAAMGEGCWLGSVRVGVVEAGGSAARLV